MVAMNDEKILSEEKLSDEELENVAGGKWEQTYYDVKFLNRLNGSCRLHRSGDDIPRSEVENAWRALGVNAEVHWNTSSNHYYIGGKEVSQEAAREYVMEMTGKFMSRSEWI